MWRGREVPRKCSNLNKTTGAAPAASFSRWEDFQRSLRNFANKMLCCWSCARLSYIPPSRWRTLAFPFFIHTWECSAEAWILIVMTKICGRAWWCELMWWLWGQNLSADWQMFFFHFKSSKKCFKVEFTFSQYLAAQCRIVREEEWMKCHQSLINVIKWARAGVAVAVAAAGEKSWNSEDTLAVVTNLREIQKYRIILSGCPKATS